jgi:hypothetical protein
MVPSEFSVLFLLSSNHMHVQEGQSHQSKARYCKRTWPNFLHFSCYLSAIYLHVILPLPSWSGKLTFLEACSTIFGTYFFSPPSNKEAETLLLGLFWTLNLDVNFYQTTGRNMAGVINLSSYRHVNRRFHGSFLFLARVRAHVSLPCPTTDKPTHLEMETVFARN